MTRLPQAPYIRTSLLALGLATALMITAFVRAVRIPVVEAASTETGEAVVHGTTIAPVPGVDIGAVGANDVFQPDRTAMPSRFRMPGDAGPAVQGPPPPEPPKPIVLGTVISTDGSHFATCQMPGGRATLVHVGDRLGDYTVTSIERNKVVFKNPKGMSLEIVALRPGT